MKAAVSTLGLKIPKGGRARYLGPNEVVQTVRMGRLETRPSYLPRYTGGRVWCTQRVDASMDSDNYTPGEFAEIRLVHLNWPGKVQSTA